MFNFSRTQLNHLLLLFFILSVVGGSIFLDFKVFGIQFYAYRVVVLLGLFYFLVTRQMVFYTSGYEKYVFWFLSIWFVYGVGSLYWCPDRASAFKEIVYIFIGFCTYLFLLSLRKKIRNFEEKFAEFWIFVFFCVVVFSINEIITKSHFQSSFTESISKFGEAHKINSVPVFTFDNPNHYAIYLCVTIIFSLYLLLKKIHVRLNVLALICALVILYYMESRLSYLFLFFTVLGVLYLKLPVFRQWQYFRILKWSGIALGTLMAVGVALLVVKKMSRDTSSASPATYEMLVDQDKGPAFLSDSLAGSHGNDVCLGMDNELEYRVSFKKEVVNTRYVNLEDYSGRNEFLKKNANLKKIAFPAACIIWVLILAFFLYKRKERQQRILLVFGGFVGLFLIGVFSRHPFERVNEKWSNYAVIEAVSKSETDSIAQALWKNEKGIKRISFQNETALKYMQGKEITLKLAEVPVPSPETTGSNAIRKNLILAGIDFLKRSHYMGVGAGGYSALVRSGEAAYDVGTIDTPHNFLIEILSQYGILITLFFLAVLLYPLVYLLNEFRHKRNGNDHLALLLFLVCMILMSNSNSSALPLPIIWINFTLVILFFGKLVTANEKVNDPKN